MPLIAHTPKHVTVHTSNNSTSAYSSSSSLSSLPSAHSLAVVTPLSSPSRLKCSNSSYSTSITSYPSSHHSSSLSCNPDDVSDESVRVSPPPPLSLSSLSLDGIPQQNEITMINSGNTTLKDTNTISTEMVEISDILLPSSQPTQTQTVTPTAIARTTTAETSLLPQSLPGKSDESSIKCFDSLLLQKIQKLTSEVEKKEQIAQEYQVKTISTPTNFTVKLNLLKEMKISSDFAARVSSLEAEKAQLTSDVASSQQSIADLRSELESCHQNHALELAEKDFLRSEIETSAMAEKLNTQRWKEKAEQAESSIELMKDQINLLASERQAWQTNDIELNAQLSHLRSSMDAQSAEAHEAMAAQGAELNATNRELKKIRIVKEALVSKLAQLRGVIQSRDVTIEQLRFRLSAANESEARREASSSQKLIEKLTSLSASASSTLLNSASSVSSSAALLSQADELIRGSNKGNKRRRKKSEEEANETANHYTPTSLPVGEDIGEDDDNEAAGDGGEEGPNKSAKHGGGNNIKRREEIASLRKEKKKKNKPNKLTTSNPPPSSSINHSNGKGTALQKNLPSHNTVSHSTPSLPSLIESRDVKDLSSDGMEHKYSEGETNNNSLTINQPSNSSTASFQDSLFRPSSFVDENIGVGGKENDVRNLNSKLDKKDLFSATLTEKLRNAPAAAFTSSPDTTQDHNSNTDVLSVIPLPSTAAVDTTTASSAAVAPVKRRLHTNLASHARSNSQSSQIESDFSLISTHTASSTVPNVSNIILSTQSSLPMHRLRPPITRLQPNLYLTSLANSSHTQPQSGINASNASNNNSNINGAKPNGNGVNNSLFLSFLKGRNGMNGLTAPKLKHIQS